jgi:ParB-like chromosome segregation protein Spo0J
MRGVLAEIGYADALVARELADGSLELIDGHLRAETTPDMSVPVLVVDLDDQEALKLLATLDPLSAMAERDDQMLGELLADLHTDNEAVRAMLASLAEQQELAVANSRDYQDIVIENTFQVVVECEDEQQQRELFERLRDQGLKCRVLSL